MGVQTLKFVKVKISATEGMKYPSIESLPLQTTIKRKLPVVLFSVMSDPEIIYLDMKETVIQCSLSSLGRKKNKQ